MITQRRLKVLIASHACATPQNQALFADAARERNWDVTLCLPRWWKDEYGQWLPARLMEGFDARLTHFPVTRNGSVPLHVYLGRLGRLIRDVNPDVIYSHNEAYAASTIQWCWANARTLARPFGFYSCQNILKRYPTPFRQGEAWVYKHSRFFFPITHNVDQVHRDKGYTGRSTIVPLGYDARKFYPKQAIETRHLQAEGRPVQLVYAGRVVEEKGLITLAAALGQLTDLDWDLLIAGGGDYELQVKAAMADHGVSDHVQWLGFVGRDEMPALFESADLMVLPSETRSNWKEQFGRVILESIACGTPVVGSDSGEIPYLIREINGGAVFHESQPDSLAESLRTLMTNHSKRAQVAIEAASYVSERYTLDDITDQFADAIEEAALNR
ncbi:MAG: glycosyltransferase family 4 protein [Planctomycetota bacterium]